MFNSHNNFECYIDKANMSNVTRQGHVRHGHVIITDLTWSYPLLLIISSCLLSKW